MFKIIAMAVHLIGGEPFEITNNQVYATVEECEAARPANGTVVIVDMVPTRINTSECRQSPDAEAMISDVLRLMTQGGGFGTTRP